jgi:hypothetical protein
MPWLARFSSQLKAAAQAPNLRRIKGGRSCGKRSTMPVWGSSTSGLHSGAPQLRKELRVPPLLWVMSVRGVRLGVA